MNRFAMLILWLFSFGGFCCEIEKEQAAMLYSSSCAVKNASSHTTEPVFLQFKFSGKSRGDIIDELNHVQQKLNVGVAAQKTAKGYRLLLGPIATQDTTYFSQQLKLLGYNSTLLRTVPRNSMATITAPATSSSNSLNQNSTFAKVLGEVAQRKLFSVVDPDGRLIKTTYPAALKACAAIGDSAAIATQDEYVALLSSDYALSLLGGELVLPFWLNQQWVVTRLDEQVHKRRAVPDVQYHVVCRTSS